MTWHPSGFAQVNYRFLFDLTQQAIILYSLHP